MELVHVGPFTVHQLSVGEGLSLMDCAGPENTTAFNTKLIELCVRKGGKPVLETVAFAELMPHMTAVVSEALRLNGFGVKKVDEKKGEPRAIAVG
jgi:hypothetical protein